MKGRRTGETGSLAKGQSTAEEEQTNNKSRRGIQRMQKAGQRARPKAGEYVNVGTVTGRQRM